MAHVMIDMETWGVRPGSALRSLGAVVFDPKTGALGKTFYANIDDESCARAGLTKDQSTIDWWAQQSADAREALAVNPRPLIDVLAEFHAWFGEVGGEFVWSHGATFDVVLLEAAYLAVGVTNFPWKFWNVRCCRTVLALGNRRVDTTRVGVHHNALNDAESQAKAVAAALRTGIKL